MRTKSLFYAFLLLFLPACIQAQEQTPEEINSVIAKIQKSRYNDDHYEKAYAIFNEQVEGTSGVSQAIWYYNTAELLYDYYFRNIYQIWQRTPVLSEEGSDFKSWDMHTFFNVIRCYYLKVLDQKERLKATSVEEYKILFDTVSDKSYRPSLYDAFAQSALRVFMYAERESSQRPPFPIDASCFSDNEQFLHIKLDPADSLSFRYGALTLFQELTEAHRHDADPLVLIDITLNRLRYIKNQTGDTLSDYLYEKALLRLEEKYRDRNGYADICYQLGLFYHNKASSYIAEKQSDSLWNYKTAVKWLQKSADKNTAISGNAKNLLDLIQEKSLQLTLQESLPAHQPNLIEVVYRNCDSMFIRVIPVSVIEYYAKFRYGELHYPGSRYDNRSKFDSLLKEEYLFQWQYALINHHDYAPQKGEIILPPLPSGNYIVWSAPYNFEKENASGYTIAFIQVSNIAYSKKEQRNKEHLLIYHRMTGEPIQKAKLQVNYLKRRRDIIEYRQRRKTDQNGLTVLTPFWGRFYYGRTFFEVTTHADTLIDLKHRQSYHYRHWPVLMIKRTCIMTDRAIYRPGQTIHFKAIRVRKTRNSTKVLPARNIKMRLSGDDNEVAQIKLKTNRFGSCSGSFDIPAEIKTGQYYIRHGNNRSRYSYRNSLPIRIEEYKRPQFEVIVAPPAKAYALNEEVEIEGKVRAFSGFPVDKAKIIYEIRRSSPSETRYASGSHRLLISRGETVTDHTGKFSFVFTAESDRNSKEHGGADFEITVKAIDVSGETQQTQYKLFIASKALNIKLEMPEILSKDRACTQFPLSVVNTNGFPVPAEVRYRITTLRTPDQFLIQHSKIKPTGALVDIELLKKTFPYRDFEGASEKDNWPEIATIHSGTIYSGTDSLLSIPLLPTLSEGYYKIILTTTDQFDTEVKETVCFFLHDPSSKACKAYTPVFLATDKTVAKLGDTVTITVGSYYEDAHVYLEFFTGENKSIKSEWVVLNKEKKIYKLPIQKKYKEGVIVSALCTKFNQTDHQTLSVTIHDPKASGWIEVRSESFKDKVTPGQEEEWHIRLKNVNGKKTVAEALATMYDASLDQFTPSVFINDTWIWGKRNKLYAFPFKTDINYYSEIRFRKFQDTQSLITPRFYPVFMWIFSNYSKYLHSEYVADRTVARVVAGRSVSGVLFDIDLSSELIQGGIPAEYGSSSVRGNRSDGQRTVIDGVPVRGSAYNPLLSSGETGESMNMLPPEKESLFPVAIRRDFNETAFFYPHLKTDKKGTISFTFKTTGSLTRWNFQFFAHTKKGNIGYYMQEILAQKELMVVPNTPRFFREGDTLDFAAKVVSLAEEELSGNVIIEFTNAMTGEALPVLLHDNTLLFNIKRGESFDAKYTIVIPVGVGAITYTIKAMTEKFSDGETKTVPVLSNRILITESMPLYVNGHDTTHFILDNLKNNTSPTLEHYRYTLEFTSNPSWYAIQALPYLMQYPYECNEQIFSKMYANSMGLHILNASPQLKALFEKWEALPEEKFMSNLEKNQELKSVILEESPWLFDARIQQVHKQRMGLLFNLKKMSGQQSNASDKLERRQNGNGSWSWFAGGKENYFITQHIVAGLGHLKSMGVDLPVSNSTVSKAVAYIDREMAGEYRKWCENNGKPKIEDTLRLPALAFHYLYARSYFSNEYPLKENHAAFYEQCVQKAKQSWQNESIYMQAMIALALYRNGDKEIASDIVKSLKEKSQYSDEMGMFWKKEGAGFYWYEAPVERQVALIEAFGIVLQDHESVEKMQRWLLKQRQTQDWGSTKATAGACYALLLRGKEPGFKEPDVILSIGNQQIAPSRHPDAEPGSGYYKTAWERDEITPDMAEITVANHAGGVAWGGIYWQYFEESHRVKSAQTSLRITKEIYKVTLNDQGEFLTKITHENPLQVGDKVMVKLIINTDRDMEYVHLKDMRAGAFEPLNVLSGYKYQGGLYYYESTRDAATNFFIDYLPKGSYVIEYGMFASQTGSFSNGIATIQCMYAPEFSAQSEGIKVNVR